MTKNESHAVFVFGCVVACILSWPLLSIFISVDKTEQALHHEYTVLDLETGTKMIMFGDERLGYRANDTAWRDDKQLYPCLQDAPDNAMQVVIVATHNQLYE